MQITLSKSSDVPLRQQLAEQIVFLITTGQLKVGEELPSVRAFARQNKVHHNTVSEAYKELVLRGWLTRRRGSQLLVGAGSRAPSSGPHSIDELINESIQRAKVMGYSLQALRERVSERLLAQPPDHLLVVEQESGLREIIRREVHQLLNWPAEGCSLDEFKRERGLAIGAQVLAANHLVEDLKPLVPQNRPPIAIMYSPAIEHIEMIRKIQRSSIVAFVSVSESMLRTARGVFASAIARKHTLTEILIVEKKRVHVGAADLIFCDSITLPMVRSQRKIHYRLISPPCLESLSSSLDQSR